MLSYLNIEIIAKAQTAYSERKYTSDFEFVIEESAKCISTNYLLLVLWKCFRMFGKMCTQSLACKIMSCEYHVCMHVHGSQSEHKIKIYNIQFELKNNNILILSPIVLIK